MTDADPKNKDIPQTTGGRFRYAREISPIPRTVFCRKHKINYNTVQSWEISRNVCRSPNVTKFCRALAAEGIVCTEDWLIDGIGPQPYLASSPEAGVYVPPIRVRQPKKKTLESPEDLVHKEIALFYDHSLKMQREGIAIQVSNSAMAPDYEAGEFIGGCRIPLNQIDRLHQTICLIEAKPHHFLVRRLLKEGEAYILLATNKDSPVICLDEITSAAEIVWRRRIPTFFFRKEEHT